ncbi:retention module-containing protein, partial [Brenneria sp. KBI 447]
MNSVIGIIKFVIGQVFVVALDGSQRLLTAGDRIYSGEEIVTGDNGAVSITLPDGRTLDLGRNSRWSDVADATQQKTEDAEDDVAALQAAIEQGADPTQVLEATAAGNDSTGEAGDGGGSHTTVVLDLTGQVIDVTAGYTTAESDFVTDGVEGIDDADTQSLAGAQLSEEGTGNENTGNRDVITLSSNSQVTEGSAFTVTATVGSPVTGSPLVITLSNDQTITIPVGESSGTVQIATRGDDGYQQGEEPITVGIKDAAGGNYEALDTSSTTTTTVVDNSDTTAITLSSDNQVTEGSAFTVTATVGAPVTGSPLVITLSNDQTITIPVGESSGTVQIATRGDDGYQQGEEALTLGIKDTAGGNYEALDTTSTTTTTVVDNSDTTAITLSADNQVTEGSVFTVTATVGAPVTGSPLVITLSNDQTITIPVGESSGTVQIATRGDDGYQQGDEALTIGIKDTVGGNFEALDTSSTTTTTVVDNSDTTTLTLGDITVAEGSGTATIGA